MRPGLVLLEFVASNMSDKEAREAFLRELAGVDVDFALAEIEPTGRARIEFPSSDIDVKDVRDLQRWLERRPGIHEIRISLAPDREAPA